jgi:hypothetical protein
MPCATLPAMKAFASELHSLLKGFSAAILIAAPWARGSAQTHKADTYTPSTVFHFEPIIVNGRNEFHVIESFRARQTETKIIVPTHWGSAAHLEDQTNNLRLDSPERL